MQVGCAASNGEFNAGISGGIRMNSNIDRCVRRCMATRSLFLGIALVFVLSCTEALNAQQSGSGTQNSQSRQSAGAARNTGQAPAAGARARNAGEAPAGGESAPAAKGGLINENQLVGLPMNGRSYSQQL